MMKFRRMEEKLKLFQYFNGGKQGDCKTISPDIKQRKAL